MSSWMTLDVNFMLRLSLQLWQILLHLPGTTTTTATTTVIAGCWPWDQDVWTLALTELAANHAGWTNLARALPATTTNTTTTTTTTVIAGCWLWDQGVWTLALTELAANHGGWTTSTLALPATTTDTTTTTGYYYYCYYYSDSRLLAMRSGRVNFSIDWTSSEPWRLNEFNTSSPCNYDRYYYN